VASMQKQTSINPKAGIGRCYFDFVLNRTFFVILPEDKFDELAANFLVFFYFFDGIVETGKVGSGSDFFAGFVDSLPFDVFALFELLFPTFFPFLTFNLLSTFFPFPAREATGAAILGFVFFCIFFPFFFGDFAFTDLLLETSVYFF
jgi:hypothetical protein